MPELADQAMSALLALHFITKMVDEAPVTIATHQGEWRVEWKETLAQDPNLPHAVATCWRLQKGNDLG